ncbi:MAG: hypothetical protein KGJ90_04440 [Patescibacteria group bacterium]|nr:hypothetical protein [Patescibacteria group bacterium]
MRKFILAIALIAISTFSAKAQTYNTPTLPLQLGHHIGVIGCSNTLGAAYGYYLDGGSMMLWPTYPIGGGRIYDWANPQSPYWTMFQHMVALYGIPPFTFVNLCEEYLTIHDTYDEVKAMLANLQIYAPGTIPYISAINEYSPSVGLCNFMGPQGQGETDTQTWAFEAVQDRLAKQGPSLGPLTQALVASPAPNGCHPNQDGMTLLGQQLHQFFDNLK